MVRYQRGCSWGVAVLQLGEGPQDLGQVPQAEAAQAPAHLGRSRPAEARRRLLQLRKGPQRVGQALNRGHLMYL